MRRDNRPKLRGFGVRAEQVALDLVPIPIGAVDFVGADLHQRTPDRHLRNDLARQRAARHARGGFPRRGAAAAAIIAQAVFHIIDVVGVARAINIFDFAVIFRSLVGVFDQQRHRRSGGHLEPGRLVDEHAGQNLDLVGLLPLRGEARLARSAFVEKDLDVAFLERQARRTAVDDAAERRPVAFAEGGKAEHMAKTIVRHGDRSRLARLQTFRAGCSHMEPPTLRCGESIRQKARAARCGASGKRADAAGGRRSATRRAGRFSLMGASNGLAVSPTRPSPFSCP